MTVLKVVVTLLYVFQGINEATSREEQIPRLRQNGPPEKPSLYVLDLNKNIEEVKPIFFKWQDLFNIGSILNHIFRNGNKRHEYYTSKEAYCKVIASNTNQHISELVTLFQELPSLGLRTSNTVLLCERNCSQMAMKLCPSCIEATLNILSYSCRRKCQLSAGELEYLHNQDVHPGPEYMCKRKKAEYSKCCKDNCLRSIFKQCFLKKVRICTSETVQVLKTSCISKCERGSNNAYLNAFCSFVFKYKKKRRLYLNMSSTYFWESLVTSYPLYKHEEELAKMDKASLSKIKVKPGLQ